MSKSGGSTRASRSSAPRGIENRGTNVNETERTGSVKVPDRFYFNDNREAYERAVLDALTSEYKTRMTRGGNIEVYRKGDRVSLKNLLFAINSSSYIDYGPNERLRPMFDERVKEALKKAYIKLH